MTGKGSADRVQASKRLKRWGVGAVWAEGLESRHLLSGVFGNGDMTGTWSQAALGSEGTIQFNASGVVSGGFVQRSDGTSTNLGGTYQIDSSGATHVITGSFDKAGAMNATRDLIVGTVVGQNGTSSFSDTLTVDVKHTATAYADADLNGSWSMFFDGNSTRNTGQGVVVFDGKGGIKSGSTVDAAGSAKITGGSYTVSSTGAVTAIVNIRGTGGATKSLSLTGELNASKDTLAMNPTDLTAAADAHESRMFVFTQSAGKFSNASLSNTWTFSADGYGGTMVFNGAGKVTGGTGEDTKGNAITLTGTYTVSGKGVVTVNVLINDAVTGPSSRTFHGAINTGGNFAAMVLTPKVSGDGSSEDSLMLLVNSAGHAPVLGKIGKLSGATEGEAFTVSYNSLKSTASDQDGDAISFVIEQIANGTVSINGSPAASGATFGALDTVTWTPADNSSGTVTAFTVKASDGTLLSGTLAPVQVVTGKRPTVTLASKGKPSRVDGTGKGAAVFTFTRSRDGVSSPLTVDFTLAGSGVEGTDYATLPNHTAHFDAGKTAATVTINPKDSLSLGAKTLSVTAVSDGPPATYHVGSKSSVTVTIAADTRDIILGTIQTLTGATKNTPFAISYAALLAATGATDASGNPITFKITKVVSGSLTKNGAAVAAGGTLAVGETLTLTPAANAVGTLTAFDVEGVDGTSVTALAAILVQVT